MKRWGSRIVSRTSATTLVDGNPSDVIEVVGCGKEAFLTRGDGQIEVETAGVFDDGREERSAVGDEPD